MSYTFSSFLAPLHTFIYATEREIVLCGIHCQAILLSWQGSETKCMGKPLNTYVYHMHTEEEMQRHHHITVFGGF